MKTLRKATKPIQVSLEFEGIEIPVLFTPSSNKDDPIIFSFHGAVDRSKRTLPVFTPAIPELGMSAHQMSIADPTLFRSESLRIGWYMGHEDMNLQMALRRLFSEVSAQFNNSRRIYLGSSGGGFAALLYSWYDPESIALVLNPQVVVQNYYPRLVSNYVQECWPNAETLEDLKGQITANVASLYKNGSSNTVIYVQSSVDFDHFYGHLLPFLTARTPEDHQYLHLESTFWGQFGHPGPSKPIVLDWLNAILKADTTSLQDVLSTRMSNQSVAQTQETPQPDRPAPSLSSAGFSSKDLELSDALSKWSLS